ncbi:hypothetical protein [Ottowia sp. oral taxon 894]|jgi:hypothetical protein|uniref:hypothetical protein n=1 Tax=Ottowia sp. oral taxon 894 TaxID=1658672 RepID=UPI0012E29734|nr:hypothetical protein [Ottowia sp. oral taxon 894]
MLRIIRHIAYFLHVDRGKRGHDGSVFFHSGGARLISDSFLRPIAALFSFD